MAAQQGDSASARASAQDACITKYAGNSEKPFLNRNLFRKGFSNET
jgi:hypothetical protein